jgi:hypothetical protein
MTSRLRLTRDFDVGVARSSKPPHDAKLGKAPDPNVWSALCAGSSVCVVPHVIGRAISATPARSPRTPPRAAEGVNNVGPVASTVGIPIDEGIVRPHIASQRRWFGRTLLGQRLGVCDVTALDG